MLRKIRRKEREKCQFVTRASPSQREELPVREEVVEDEAGVISSVIVPTLTPVAEDTMEEELDSTVEVPQ